LRQAIEGPANSPAPGDPDRSPGPAFVPPAPAELARHFPQLEILELVGQGGMGAVYKARQAKLDRLLAVKVLPPEVARDPAFAERFAREARSLARLNHSNIVTIFDFGESDGLYYFTMEFVDGRNVRELLQAGPLTVSQTLAIVPQVCQALEYAHDEGIIHRDIKPENILLDRKGRAKIADFGLARIVGLSPAYLSLTASQEVLGTLYYMAPEQVTRSRSVDHRADLYSLGVVLYEMLTGELPLGRFAPPSRKAPVDPRLDAIVLRALVREPEQRYQDAAQLRKELEDVLAGRPETIAGPPTPAPAGIPSDWPIVRFTIPGVTWYGGIAKGEIYRDGDTLMVEFKEPRLFAKDERKELRIPFADIKALACQTKGFTGTTEIIIKGISPNTLASLPVGETGSSGRLRVFRADRQAAQDLVDSVIRSASGLVGADWRGAPQRDAHAPAPMVGIDGPGGVDRLQPSPERERVRRSLLAPAIGLIVTASAVLAGSIWQTIAIAHEIPEGGPATAAQVIGLSWAAVAKLGVVLMVVGAVHMLSLRSYVLAKVGAIAALVPCAPAWSQFHMPGLFWMPIAFGIWALVLLGRGDVRAAFGRAGRAMTAGEPGARPPQRPVVGAVWSFARACARSFAGYFVPGFSRRAARPLPPTLDYAGKPEDQRADGRAPGGEK
jgi:tRNA A-37 threonylcarbamoyl transferase component Bud32